MEVLGTTDELRDPREKERRPATLQTDLVSRERRVRRPVNARLREAGLVVAAVIIGGCGEAREETNPRVAAPVAPRATDTQVDTRGTAGGWPLSLELKAEAESTFASSEYAVFTDLRQVGAVADEIYLVTVSF